MARPRMIVPRHMEWIDNDSYGSDAGASSHAGLGRRMIWNDRALAGHVFRSFGHAWPQSGTDLPEVTDSNGTIIGPWPFYATDGAASGEWYLRASLANNETAVVQPFAAQPDDLEPLLGPHNEAPYIITGSGSTENYGPFPCKVRPGGMLVGICIYPTTDGVAFQSGDIEDAGIRNRNVIITNTAGALLWDAWNTAGTTRDHMIRIIDGSSQVALSQWHKAFNLSTTTDTNDTLSVIPDFSDSVLLNDQTKGDLKWQSMLMVPITLYSIYFREKSLPDEDYNEAVYHG